MGTWLPRRAPPLVLSEDFLSRLFFFNRKKSFTLVVYVTVNWILDGCFGFFVVGLPLFLFFTWIWFAMCLCVCGVRGWVSWFVTPLHDKVTANCDGGFWNSYNLFNSFLVFFLIISVGATDWASKFFVFKEHLVCVCAVFLFFFSILQLLCMCLFSPPLWGVFFWFLLCLICVGMFATPLRPAHGGFAALHCANIVGVFTFSLFCVFYDCVRWLNIFSLGVFHFAIIFSHSLGLVLRIVLTTYGMFVSGLRAVRSPTWSRCCSS